MNAWKSLLPVLFVGETGKVGFLNIELPLQQSGATLSAVGFVATAGLNHCPTGAFHCYSFISCGRSTDVQICANFGAKENQVTTHVDVADRAWLRLNSSFASLGFWSVAVSERLLQ